MSDRSIYVVMHPDHDYDLTVIAESTEEARDIAIAYYEEEGPACDDYTVSHDPSVNGLRWVEFESREEAEDQLADFRAVCPYEIFVWARVSSIGSFDANLMKWEVGAHDGLWAMLPSGVLCGGDQ